MTIIESRLAVVERQLRLLRAVIVGLLLALVALVGLGATEEVPDQLTARQFVAVNRNGKTVVMAGTDLAEQSGWWVYNKDGPVVVAARADANGDGELAVGNKDRPVILATTDYEGNGILGVSDKDGGNGVGVYGGVHEFVSPAGGGGAVLVYDKTGNAVVCAYADQYGMGFVGAYDREGKDRAHA